MSGPLSDRDLYNLAHFLVAFPKIYPKNNVLRTKYVTAVPELLANVPHRIKPSKSQDKTKIWIFFE